ncbi:hypothetical protein COX74_02865, partial [bacterium (Candidatus Gribaldobacteria) CG_4_10_14_0_2_um_filter_41_16]
ELNEIIGLVEKKLGLTAKKEFTAMQPGDLTTTWADITKAKKLLDWRPAISLEDGIAKFVDWYKDYNGIK